MRKWMRERLQRRKKAPETKPSEPAQAPLQPAYFEGEASPAPAVDRKEAKPETEAVPAETEPTSEAPGGESEASEVSVTGSPARPRRRRSRGGRGRKGQRSGVVAGMPPVETKEPLTPKAPAEQVPSEAVPAAPARPPKGAVILAIGLPGSGKSSWFKRHNITPLSSDMLRLLLFDDAQEQRFQDLIFSNLRSMLKARLIARRPLNYVDATNLTPHERHSWIKLAKDYGYEVQAVFFEVPVEVCLERNQRRDRVVDEAVLRRMAAKLKPPTFEEGFSKVTVVRVKKKENEVAS
jgi:predicted kinase